MKNETIVQPEVRYLIPRCKSQELLDVLGKPDDRYGVCTYYISPSKKRPGAKIRVRSYVRGGVVGDRFVEVKQRRDGAVYKARFPTRACKRPRKIALVTEYQRTVWKTPCRITVDRWLHASKPSTDRETELEQLAVVEVKGYLPPDDPIAVFLKDFKAPWFGKFKWASAELAGKKKVEAH